MNYDENLGPEWDIREIIAQYTIILEKLNTNYLTSNNNCSICNRGSVFDAWE